MITRNRLLVLTFVLLAGFISYRQFFHVDIVNPNPSGTTIIAFGDSLTAGTGAAAGEDYPSQLSKLCGCEIINRGEPGETTGDALRRLQTDVLDADPRIV